MSCIVVIVDHGIQKMLLYRTNKLLKLVRVRNSFTECANKSLKKFLRMKLLNGIAWIVHNTSKAFSFGIGFLQ